MIPRIRGRVGKGDDDKFYFEIILTELGARDNGESMGTFGPYDTEQEASKELRLACKKTVEVIERELTGGVSGEVINMKTNKVQGWGSFLAEAEGQTNDTIKK